MSGYDLPPGAVPLAAATRGYGVSPVPVPHQLVQPIPVVGGGGPAWRQYPHRSEYLPPEIFSTAELVGLGAAGASGAPRQDPMMIRSGDIITRPSGFWPAQTDPTGVGYNVDGSREPMNILSGPPVLDPNNRVLVPEHTNEHGQVTPAHWQHLPFNALRLRVVPNGDIDGQPVTQAVGAIVRVAGSAPFGGVSITREFFLTPSMEACLMAGKYRQFRVDILALTGNSRLAWEWFNDQSGICAETKLWSEIFTVANGARFTVPPGAVEAFFEAPVRVGWASWNGIANNIVGFDRGANSALAPAGTAGVAVRGQEIQPVLAVGVPLTDVNVQFRLSPI